MDGMGELLVALVALFATLWLATRWSQRLRRDREARAHADTAGQR